MFKYIITLTILLSTALLYSFSNEDSIQISKPISHNTTEENNVNTIYQISKKNKKEMKENLDIEIVKSDEIKDSFEFIEYNRKNNLSFFKLNSYLQMILVLDYENKKYYLDDELLRSMKTVKIINNIYLDDIPIENIPKIVNKDTLSAYISFLKKEIPVKLKPNNNYLNFANILDFYNYDVNSIHLEDYEIENMLYDYIEDFKIYAEQHKSSFNYCYYDSNNILDLINKIRRDYSPLPRDIKNLLNRVENKVSSMEIIVDESMFHSIKRLVPLFKMSSEEKISNDYYTALKIIELNNNILEKRVKKAKNLKNIFLKNDFNI